MSQNSGSSSMPIVAVISAVALSVALFFAFTLPQCSGKKVNDTVDTGAAPQQPVTAVEPVPPVEPEPDPEPPKIEKFATPSALLGSLAQRLSAGDMAGAQALIGEEPLSKPRAHGFLHTFGAGGYVPAPGEPFVEIGAVDQVNRWALYAVPKDATGTEIETRERITIDVERAPETGWAVANVHVPSSLRQAAVTAGVNLPEGADSTAAIALDRADPLFVAEDFVGSLLSQNFEQALKLCGEKVLDEKIAGLCMVFEEGEFRMVKEKPLTTTSLGAEKAAAWVFARVRSDKLDTNSEFAVELKSDPQAGWQIENVNIESMLQEFVKSSEAGRVPFSPIKKNPDGGDTLVLYFEYDKAELLPRSLRQVDILSRILKADSKKTLNIGGHADALGTDEYNRKLSEARGISVREALINFGVPESQILVTAYGEAKPWKENTADDGSDNPEGRQHNRRAEIYLNF